MNKQTKILGGLYGSLVGDALGVPVEFKSRRARDKDPVVDMRSYGTHGQPKGTWSDDGALILCSVESLINCPQFDVEDMGKRFVQWYIKGLCTTDGNVFDIGFATRRALNQIALGAPAKDAGGWVEEDNGNGSLMRILPIQLASLDVEVDEFIQRTYEASAITHRHVRSQLACLFHGLFVRQLMYGMIAEDALKIVQTIFPNTCSDAVELERFKHLLSPEFSEISVENISSSGYVVDTLSAAIWCLLNTKSYAECVLKAVNLGDDTDTTACVAGGLAGILYGVDSIPGEWKSSLPRQNDLTELFSSFIAKLNC